MRSSGSPLLALLVALVLLLAPAGCALSPSGDAQEMMIEPAPAEPSGSALGPGTRPISFGPGDKGSPRVSPSGERVAFVIDGTVVEKSLYIRDGDLRTEEGFGAQSTEWLSENRLAVLLGEGAGEPFPLYVTRSEDPPDVGKLLDGVEAADTLPGGDALVAAVEEVAARGDEPAGSKLVRVRDYTSPVKVYPGKVQGSVTGLSVSPDGQQAILAVQRESGEATGRVELLAYRFSEGVPRRVALLDQGLEVLGAPQWTSQGIHFVAGEAGQEGEEASPYALYRVPIGSEKPEPVRGVGEGFVPAGVRVSPEGERLAVVGRRNPGSPTDLYVLDLASDTLEAVTANEGMEIKTSPYDLAWYPDGSRVVLVARAAFSGPKVYDAPAESLSSAFYNLYEVRAEADAGAGTG